MHFLSTKDLSLDWLDKLERNINLVASPDNLLPKKTMISFFAEPSTRTRFSFEAAAYKLNMNVLSEPNAATSSSLKKGESLKDTFRTLSQYGDLIVCRHPDPNWIHEAEKWSRIPVINAGSGSGEHPTQALLDIHTMRKYHGSLENLNVMLCGDLKYSRTIHSLIPILRMYNCNIFMVPSTSQYEHHSLPDDLKNNEDCYVLTEDVPSLLSGMDVIYMTRMQKERYGNHENFNHFKLNAENVKQLKEKCCILHPLPRGDEIHPDVYEDPRAIYHEEQVKNGLNVRVALLRIMT